MDYLSHLLPECLDIIITILIQDRALSSIAALVQVNRPLASAALRHLYADPFQPAFHTNDELDYGNNKEGPLKSVDALARMLLGKCLQRNRHSDGLPEVVSVVFPELAPSGPSVSVAHEDNTLAQKIIHTTPTSATINGGPLDYLSYIRHLNLCTPPAYTWLFEISNPTTLAYIKQETFQRHCGIDDLLPESQRRLGMFPPTAVLPLYHQYFRVMLLREVNWILATSSSSSVSDNGTKGEENVGDSRSHATQALLLEQLNGLTIPVSDIERFLKPEMMERLKGLEHVRFLVDEILEFPEEDVDAAFEAAFMDEMNALAGGGSEDESESESEDGEGDEADEVDEEEEVAAGEELEGEEEEEGEVEEEEGEVEEEEEATLEDEFGVEAEEEDEEVVEIEVRDKSEALLEMAKVRKEAAIENMLYFVKEHARLFPGQLQTVTCPESDIWSPLPWTALTQSVPNDLLFEIMKLLPPLRKPKVLDEGNWMQFMTHPRETYLGAVKEIDIEWDLETAQAGEKAIYGRVCEERGFLQRCRTLRRLTIRSLGSGTYSWAVEEKKATLGVTSNCNSSGTATANEGRMKSLLLQGNEDEEADRRLFLRHGLVPLEEAYITLPGAEPFTDTDEVNDIAFAFSGTLVKLNVSFSSNIQDDDDDENNDDNTTQQSSIKPTIRIGQGWVTLPNLCDLYVDTRSVRLVIDRELLSNCPNLVTVDLYDDATFAYRYQEATRDACEPAQLEHVRELNLWGWSAVTFHPDTLYSVGKNLEILTVKSSCGADDLCFVPHSMLHLAAPSGAAARHQMDSVSSVSDAENAVAVDHIMQQQQQQQQQQGLRRGEGWFRWTWDWSLPLLTKLKLNSKFAYQFQFQMLNGCPALKTLELNMHTGVSSDFSRVISRDDLYEHTSPQAKDSLAEEKERKRIVAPSLRRLEMLGRWNIVEKGGGGGEGGRNEFLGEFLTSMFPSLEDLVAKHWGGVSFEDWVSVLRKNRKEEGDEEYEEEAEKNEDEGQVSSSARPKQQKQQYNNIWSMDLAGSGMYSGDQDYSPDILKKWGLVAMGYDEDEDEERLNGRKVLERVDFKFDRRKYHVLKQ